MQHPNARLTVRGRLELVLFVDDEGHSFREAAGAFRCSVSTAFEWVARWRRATLAERMGLACLCDRSSRPHRQPRLLSPLSWSYLTSVDRFALRSVGVPTPASAPSSSAGWSGSAGPQGPLALTCNSS